MSQKKLFYFIVEARHAAAIITIRKLVTIALVLFVIFTLHGTLSGVNDSSGNNHYNQPISDNHRYVSLFLSVVKYIYIGYSLDLVICLLLAVGVFKKRHYFVLPYLIVQSLHLLSIAVLLIIHFAFLTTVSGYFFYIAFLFVLFGNEVYEYMVFVHCFRDVREEVNSGRMQMV